VRAVKQKQGNTYHYSVNDRMYSLYWQQREMLSEGQSIIALFADLLFGLFGPKELLEKMKKALADKSPIGKDLLELYYDEEFEFMNDEEREKNIIKKEENRLKEVEKIKLEINELKEVVVKNPTYSNYNNLGFAFLRYAMKIRAGEDEKLPFLKKAETNFEKSLKIEENEQAFRNLAKCQFYKNGLNEKTIHYFRKSVDLNPENIFHVFLLAGYMLLDGRFDEAIKINEVGLSFVPEKYSELIYGELINTGLFYFIVHKDNKGLEYLEKASNLDGTIKKAYTERKSYEEIFLFASCKILDHSRDRSRHELFTIIMAIINFFKNENLSFFSYSTLLLIYIERLYIYDKKDLMFDIISEVRSSVEIESGVDNFLEVLELTLPIPNLLERIEELKNNTAFAELPPDAYSILFQFLENLKSNKERFESGKKIY